MKQLIIVALVALVATTATAADKKQKAAKGKAVTACCDKPACGGEGHCATACCTALTTASDTLSYAAGKALTDGLIPYLVKQLGVDTAYMADFIDGFKATLDSGVDERMQARVAGHQVAVMMAKTMLPRLNDDLAANGEVINDKLFACGFVASLQGNNEVMTDDDATLHFTAAREAAIEAKSAAARKAGEDFLAANAAKEGVVTLASGLQYKVLVEGTGEVPALNDEVEVHYEGRLIDGTVFDSSYTRGATSRFRPTGVIRGWTEALTLMPVGSKWELYIPQQLAYGERQTGNIPAYSALIFTVELVSVAKK